MRKVVGGKEKACEYCGGTVLAIIINNDKFYQCVNCGTLTKNYPYEHIEIEGVGKCASVMSVAER